jgi:preprotein translocase subunit SecA
VFEGSVRNDDQSSSYERFLRKNRTISHAADRIIEGMGAFTHLNEAREFQAQIAAFRTEREGRSKAEASSILDRIERRLTPGRAAPEDLRLYSLACRGSVVALGILPWHHQIVTALLLAQGNIVQVPNGSGKTLAIALAAVFSALTGGNAHIATQSDYLAERDLRWMGKLYTLLGLSSGVVFTKQSLHFEHGVLQPDGITLRGAPKPGFVDQTSSEAPSDAQLNAPEPRQDVPQIPAEHQDILARNREELDAFSRSLHEEWLSIGSLKDRILSAARDVTNNLVKRRCADDSPKEWDLVSLRDEVKAQFGIDTGQFSPAFKSRSEILEHILGLITAKYEDQERIVGLAAMREMEHAVLDKVTEDQWQKYEQSVQRMAAEHPDGSIESLRAFATGLFATVGEHIATETLRYLFFFQISTDGTTSPQIPLPEETSPSADPGEARGELVHKTNTHHLVDRTLDLGEVLSCDIVYSQLSGFAFAYLSDNLKQTKADLKLKRRDFLICDECDSILLDDLRTPQSIVRNVSAPGLPLHGLHQLRQLARQLEPGRDFECTQKDLRLTFKGVQSIQELTGTDFFSPDANGLALGIMNALKAEFAYRRDEDYVCLANQIILVQQESGRLLFGHTYQDGLQEALLVKEGLALGDPHETERIATVTTKHFVRLYNTTAGASGAIGSAAEYRELYGMDSVVLEPFPVTRVDHPDLVFRTRKEILTYGVIPKALEASRSGRPVLINVPKLSDVAPVLDHLKQADAPFQILDARAATTLGEEAEVVARAGSPGLITVSSKVAARGTDIVLDPASIEAGGLFVIGVQREFDRRFDDQLRGRAGRHGNPGDSLFVTSLEDPVMAVFGGPGMQALMLKLMDEGVPIESDFITSRVKATQRAFQRRNHQTRSRVVEFDDILDRHRTIMYQIRQKVLLKDDVLPEITAIAGNWMNQKKPAIMERGISHEWSMNTAAELLGPVGSHLDPGELSRAAEVRNRAGQLRVVQEALEAQVNSAIRQTDVRATILATLDEHWRRYLSAEDDSREKWSLFEPDDPTFVVRHAETMERQFDSFFYDVGESVLISLLSSTPDKLLGAAQ